MSDQKREYDGRSAIVPVILCGGSGTRLWPASREAHPKQFLSLMDDFSLLQNTMRRALRITGAQPESLVTVTLKSLENGVRRQLGELHPAATRHILPEPSARNTAAAVAYTALYVRRRFGGEAVIWILPADHHIDREQALAAAFRTGLESAVAGNLVTFGINPTRPDTGYGYVRVGQEMGAARKADAFVEKPDIDTARAYLADGNYLWNSGMFLFRADVVLDHFATHAPDILDGVAAFLAADGDGASLYAAIPEQPFDKAIMEKSDRVAVVPCDPGWSDIGSWESLWDIRSKDADGNAVEGRAALHRVRNCLIRAGEDRLVACAGVEDIVVVDTGDAILIADRTNADAMKILVNGLKKSGCRETIDPPGQAQPWSMVKTIPGSSAPYAARELVVAPGETVSFEGHASGNKFWTVVEGKGAVRIGNATHDLTQFANIFIPSGVAYGFTAEGRTEARIVEVNRSEDNVFRLREAGGRREAA